MSRDDDINMFKKLYDKGEVVGLAIVHGLSKPGPGAGGYITQDIAYLVELMKRSGQDGQPFQEVSEREWNALRQLGLPVIHTN